MRLPEFPTRTTLPAHVRRFLANAHCATIATVNADGTPHQAVVWYSLRDDAIVVNSAEGRRWPANLRRDGHASLVVIDRTDPYSWIGLTGRTEVMEDQPTAQADIAEMARRYHADDPEEAESLIERRFRRQTRVSFRMTIDEIHDELAGD